MAWRGLYESWQLAGRLDGPAGRAMQLSVEEEAKSTTASAVRLARRAVEAADAGCWGTALGRLQEAGSEAGDVIVTAWWPWLDDGAGLVAHRPSVLEGGHSAQHGHEGAPDRVAPARRGKAEALFAAACALGQLAVGGDLDFEDVARSLLAVADRIGLGTSEAEATIAGGLRRGMARPR